MKNRYAFTVIEIVIVIACILVIALLIFPVFKRAVERVHSTQCVIKLKAISAGLMNYTFDHGHYPGAYTGLGPKVHWFISLEPYITGGVSAYTHAGQSEFEAPAWLRCPSRERRSGIDGVGYGYNYLGFGHTPDPAFQRSNEYARKYWQLSPQRVLLPERTIVVGDSHDDALTASNRSHAFLYRTTALPPVYPQRHFEGGHYLFADGHVKRFTPQALQQKIIENNPDPFYPF